MTMKETKLKSFHSSSLRRVIGVVTGVGEIVGIEVDRRFEYGLMDGVWKGGGMIVKCNSYFECR